MVCAGSIRRVRNSIRTCIKRCTRSPTIACPPVPSFKCCSPASPSAIASCGRQWLGWRKAGRSPHRNRRTTTSADFCRSRSVSAVPHASARWPRRRPGHLRPWTNPVANGAKPRKCVRPAVGFGDAEEPQIGAVAKPHPLHELHVGIGLCVLGLGHELMGLLAGEADEVGPEYVYVLEARVACEQVARKIIALLGLVRTAGRGRDHEQRLFGGIKRVLGTGGEDDG